MTDENDVAPMALPVAPGHVREVVLHELARLDTFVPGLTSDQWTQPSASAGWTVGQVVSHLNLTLGLYRRLLAAALKGRGSGTAWKAFGKLSEKIGPKASPAFNAVNNAIPHMLSEALSPEVVKGQFAAAVRELRAQLESVESGDYTRPIHYMGRPWPLSFFLTGVVNELALHGWDMESRFDPAAHLDAEAADVLPWFYWGASSYMFRPAHPLVGNLQVSLQDPSASMWWALSNHGARPERGETPQPSATVTAESSTWVLALAGRIKPEDALTLTTMTVEGDRELTKGFLGAWKIV